MSPFPLLPPWPLPPKLPQYTLSLRRRVSAPPPCRAPPLPRAVLPSATIIVPRAVSLPRRRGFCARCANERAGRVPPVVPASAHERTPRRYVPPMSARSLRLSACCFSPSPALPFLPFLFPLSPSPLYPFSCRPSLLSPPVPISPPSPRYNHTNQHRGAAIRFKQPPLITCCLPVPASPSLPLSPLSPLGFPTSRPALSSSHQPGWSRRSDVTVWGAAFKGSRDSPGVRSRAGGNVTVPVMWHGWWSKWSDVTVWGAAFKGSRDPPGVRSRAGRNVTVPCGMAVLLDVANVTLDTLHVHGWLKVLDNKPRLPRIEVRANFIIVTGRLTVGEKDKQFAAQALFTLTPNSGRQRREYAFTLFPPAEPAFPRPLGHKVFAVVGGQVGLHGLPGPLSMPVAGWVGGQVDLHGLPGPPSMPVWVRLNKTSIAGQKEIVVDADVSTWPPYGLHASLSLPSLSLPSLSLPSLSLPSLPFLLPFIPIFPFPSPSLPIHTHFFPSLPLLFSPSRPSHSKLPHNTHHPSKVFPWQQSHGHTPWPRIETMAPTWCSIALTTPLKYSHGSNPTAIPDGFGGVVEGYRVTLPAPLKYSHDGNPEAIPDGFGGAVDVRGEGYRVTLPAPLKYSHDGNPEAIPDGFGGAVDVRGEGYRILLSGPLKYSHDGNPKAVLDGFGGAVDVRGEVGLLHRNIVIYGVHETGKYELEGRVQAGGHFMVVMTQTPPFIEGVQFAYMGQQGVLGRYPLHFHSTRGHFMVFMTQTPQFIEGVQFTYMGQQGVLGR
ncbi:unnamed protein product, partial [Closterium sp. NIES-65]